MEIFEALKTARERAGWSFARMAVAAGVSEAAVRTWVSGKSIPPGDRLMNLRREMPGFAELLDQPAQTQTAVA